MSSETVPLLGKDREKNTGFYSLIPLIFAFSFSQQEILPSAVDTIKRISCYVNGADDCNDEAVQKLSASIVAAYGSINSIMVVISIIITTSMLDKIGIKKVLYAILIQAIIASITLPLAVHSSPVVSVILMISFAVTSAFGGQTAFGFAVATLVSNITHVSDRTTKLSYVEGTAFFGLTIASAFGGYLPAITGNFLSPYYFSFFIYSLCLVYLHYFISDSPHNGDLELQDVEQVKQTFTTALKDFFKPLSIILGRGRSKMNPGPLLLCLSVFILQSGSAFTDKTLIQYLSERFGFDTSRTGFYLSLLTGFKAVFLLIVFPAALPYLKRKYEEWAIHKKYVENGNENPRQEEEEVIEHVEEPASFFEVIVVRFSFTIEAFITLGIGLATNAPTVAVMICFLSVGSGSLPALKALMIAFSPSKRDRAATLGALYMVDAVGQVLSPIALGGIFAASVSKHPGLVFAVSAILIGLSTVPTYFIKGKDINR
ncbi:hypothetical protein E3Q23_02174 [Wallemia mellicola]|uniref:MFS general substrate transporter n=1 Tax=Wallemia mellicola TaxID=1708541 RepID=A0A4T0M019_9BASI|nr:hypothetical protein E3Q23_02174 [Wallemia mellicola]TIC05127.1 hypothetical protein E3Q16_02441 [Wallemia mellicola]TIC65140.1 hypothetical protein E3Q01_02339 [Wallemia mellicola]